MIQVNRLDTANPDFERDLQKIIHMAMVPDTALVACVREIITSIDNQGDAAVLAYTRDFDGVEVDDLKELKVSEERLREASRLVSPDAFNALKSAAERIFKYAEKQKLENWYFEEDNGTRLGQRVTPLDSVGLYVPGGKASYPSSVLMSAIPATVAGVPRIVMMTAAPNGKINPLLLVAANLCGLKEIWLIGGAQAIATMALGTQTIASVDKIVGPGNAYVAEAKRQVYGRVGIDFPAGPSEVLIICDGKTEPDWVAADLFSQAEHDDQARAMLLCPDENYISAVIQAMESLIENAPRATIIRQSLSSRGFLLKVRNLEEAIAIANRIAPEHLEVSVANPDSLLPMIKNAGAVFVGKYSSEVIGDYCAGPSHILPTGGAARFSSPLGVYDFQKRSSFIHCSKEGATELAGIAACLAEAEGLFAHADAAQRRMATKC